jgi:hypothetical protein
MNRLVKVVGATLVFGGTVWACMAFGDLAPGAPAWSPWLGPAAIVVGLPLLFVFGARHGEERWAAGEWVEAQGTVEREVLHGDWVLPYMRVRLTAPTHGTFKHDALISTERARGFVRESKGAPVVADVRSNDRRVVEIKTVDGKSWLLLNSERARTGARSTRDTRRTG